MSSASGKGVEGSRMILMCEGCKEEFEKDYNLRFCDRCIVAFRKGVETGTETTLEGLKVFIADNQVGGLNRRD